MKYDWLESHGKNENLFLLMFFSPLLGASGFWYILFIIYLLFALWHHKERISKWGIFYAFLYILFLFEKYDQIPDTSIWFATAKFYMGWAVVTATLYFSKTAININKILLLLSAEILFEFLLINTVVPTSILPNYPKLDDEIMTGSFFRVYSIGCNATTTSTILIMLLAYRESLIKRSCLACSRLQERIIFLLSTFAVVVLGSGTGFFLFLLLILYKFNLYKLKYVAVLFALLAGIVAFFIYIKVNEDSLFQRLSGEYLVFLWDYKLDQILNLIKQYKVTNIFWGATFKYSKEALIWGDFAFLEYYISMGVGGIVLFVLYLLKYINRINFFPILIGVIGAFHYGGICTFPGQLILAYCVLLNKRTLAYYMKPNKK